MKKSSFVAMILGTIGGVLFAIGMCMCLLPDWNSFTPGVIMGSIGAVVLLAMVMVWRKMTGKTPIQFNGKTIGITLFSIAGSLILGLGMCFVMVWSNIILGIVIGLVGILALLSLIPLIRGLK